MRDRAREGAQGRQEAAGRGQGAADEADQGQQADHLQRQRLLRRVAEGSGASAACSTTGRRSTPTARRSSPRSVKAFEKYGVLNERELHARYEVALEQYNKTINIEAQLMVLMANRYILPAAYRYQGQLAKTVAAVKAAGATREGDPPRARRDLQADRRGQAARRRAAEAARARRRRRRRRSTPSTSATRSSRRWTALREVGDELEMHRAARPVAAADLPGDAFREVADEPTRTEGTSVQALWNGGSSYVPHSRARRSRRPGPRARLPPGPSQGRRVVARRPPIARKST